MSYPQYPTGGQPPYGQPPKAGMSTGAKVGIFGCGGCLGLSIIGFVALLMIGALASTDDPATVSTAPAGAPGSEAPGGGSEDEEEPAAEEVAGLGDAVEHGDWEIIVSAIEYDVPTSDLDEFFAEEPSGQWVVVDIEATNTSSGPQYFDGSGQVLMDEDGSMYSSDIMASTGLGLLEEANPGSTVSGQLAYDVPADLTFEYMLVNGETFLDDGVRVNLE